MGRGGGGGDDTTDNDDEDVDDDEDEDHNNNTTIKQCAGERGAEGDGGNCIGQGKKGRPHLLLIIPRPIIRLVSGDKGDLAYSSLPLTGCNKNKKGTIVGAAANNTIRVGGSGRQW